MRSTAASWSLRLTMVLAVAAMSARTAGAAARGRSQGSSGIAFHPPSQWIAVGKHPLALDAADLNGDGHVDLVVADSFDGRLRLLMGRGDGSFEAPTFLETGAYVQHVLAQDLTSDGRIDLAATSPNEHKVDVYLGRGDGNFDLPFRFDAPHHPTKTIAADLDGDGDPDLAVAAGGSASVRIGLGVGNGAFRMHDRYRAVGAGLLELGDMDGDGDVDFAINDNGTGIVAYLNDGAAGFSKSWQQYISNCPGPGALSDFDGDGNLDLLFSSQQFAPSGKSLGLLQAYRGTGDGTFRPGDTLRTNHFFDFVGLADFDRDGWEDVVGIAPIAALLEVFLSRPGGQPFLVRVSNCVVPSDPRAWSAADLDEDGELDLIVVGADGWGLQVIWGMGGGRFESAVTIDTPVIPSHAAFGDVNADGLPDLVLAHLGKGIWIQPRQSAGSYGGPERIDTVGNVSGLELADLDADGRLDLIVPQQHEGIGLALQQPAGGMGAMQVVAQGLDATFVQVLDVDRDGAVDLAFLATDTHGGRSIAVLLGNGAGSFASPLLSPVPQECHSLSLGDADHDGLLDGVLIPRDPFLYWKLGLDFAAGNGDGTFQATVRRKHFGSPSAATLADMDGDGQQDLVLAHGNERRLDAHLAGSPGTGPQLIQTRIREQSDWIRAIDLESDGRQEIAVRSSASSDVRLFALDDHGSLCELVLPTGAGLMDSRFDDFDADGDLDLVTCALQFDRVTVVPNLTIP